MSKVASVVLVGCFLLLSRRNVDGRTPSSIPRAVPRAPSSSSVAFVVDKQQRTQSRPIFFSCPPSRRRATRRHSSTNKNSNYGNNNDYLSSLDNSDIIDDDGDDAGSSGDGGGRMPKLKIPSMRDFRGNLPNVELPKMPRWKGKGKAGSVIDADVDIMDENREGATMQPRQMGGDNNYLDSLVADASTSKPAIDQGGSNGATKSMLNVSLPNMTMPNITLPQVSLPEFSLPDVDIPRMPTPDWGKRKSNARDVIIDLDVQRPKKKGQGSTTGSYLDSLEPVAYAENRPQKRPMNLFGALPELDIPWGGRTKKMEKSSDGSSWTMPSNYDILSALKASTNKVTGKTAYEFGDLTRYAISRANTIRTGLRGEAGELSRRVHNGIKDGIETASVTAADVTRTIVKKISTGDFDLADVTFSLRVMMVLGADFSPVASLLPISMLLEVFGFALVSGFGERFFTMLAKEIDTRMLMNDDEDSTSSSPFPESKAGGLSSGSGGGYVAGDLTKQAIQEYTGKSTYTAGDIANSGLTMQGDTPSSDDDAMDVLKELEECLQMERELVEKLNRVSGSRPVQ